MPNLLKKNTPPRTLLPSHHDRTASLTALETGQLNYVERYFLLRHLAFCPTCRAERERIALLSAGLRSLATAPAPALREPVPETPTNRFTVLPSRLWEMGKELSMPNRIAIIATVSLVLIGVIVTTLPGGPVHPVIAFARVEQAMDQVKTATWTERLYYPNDKNGRKPSEGSNMWVRLDPPTQLRKVTPYYGAPKGTRFLTTPRGILVYSPGESYFNLFGTYSAKEPGHVLDAKELRSDIHDSLIFPRDTGGQSTDRTRDAPFKWRESRWKSNKTRLNGVETLCFTRHSVRYRDDTASWRNQKSQEYSETVYADPQTFLVVRRELNTGHSLTISDNFHYNAVPPPDTFAVTVPIGQTVIVSDTTRTGCYAPVSVADRRGAEGAVRLLTEARNRNDWEAYVRVRDFEFVPQRRALMQASVRNLPMKQRRASDHPVATTEPAYRAQVHDGFLKGNPYRSWRIDSIERVEHSDTYLFTRREESDEFPPRTSPDTFVVLSKLTLVTTAGKMERKQAAYTVRKIGDAFRVASVQFFAPSKRSVTSLSPAEAGMRAAIGGNTDTKKTGGNVQSSK